MAPRRHGRPHAGSGPALSSPTGSGRWERLKDIVSEALDRKPEEREAWLAAACAGDEELHATALRLLARQADADVMDVPASAILGFDDEAGEARDPLLGARVGPWRLDHRIGQGGMGSVYRAHRHDGAFSQVVAVKVMRFGLDTDELHRRFRTERQILAGLAHPFIARLLDGGSLDDGRPYLVMEHVEGRTIDTHCEERGLSLRDRLSLFLKVCEGVHYAHQRLIVHRDLKPANVLVTAEGVPKLLDFGIAKLLAPEPGDEAHPATATGLRLMTPDYASPEQVRGEPVTTAADTYALGMMLYELLTGTRPYRLSRRSDEMARIVTEEEPEPPSAAAPLERVRRELKGDLDRIVLMALRKDPLRRYPSVEAFSEDLARHLAGLPVRARKDTFTYRAGKFVQRNRTGMAAAGVVLAVLVAGVLAVTTQRDNAERQRMRAEASEHRIGQLLYAAQMNLAYQAWETGNAARAMNLLESQRPAPGAEDLRGFEWHLLRRLSHGRSSPLAGAPQRMHVVEVTRDGRTLAGGGSDGSVHLWEASTGRRLRSFPGGIGILTDLAFSPDGRRLAGAGVAGPARLWEAETGHVLRAFDTGPSTFVDLSPDGRILATGSDSGAVRLWDVNSARMLAAPRARGARVGAVQFSPNGRVLATTARDGTAVLWAVPSGREVATLHGHSWWVLAAVFSPDGATLATGGSDGHVKLWDVASGREKAAIPGDGNTIMDLAFSPDGARLAVSGEPSDVSLYDVASSTRLDILRGHKGGVWSIAFADEGRRLATGSFDGARLWDLGSNPGTMTLEGHRDWAWAVAFSPDGRTLASAGKDATVRLWDVAEGREVRRLDHAVWVNTVAFSPDGKTLATGSDDGMLRLWDGASGALRKALPAGGIVEHVAFSPSGALLAAGTNKGEIRLWNAETGQETGLLTRPGRIVWSVAFSPDGKRLATAEGRRDPLDGDADGVAVTVWEVTSGSLVAKREAHTDEVRAASFSPDGRILASGGLDGAIRLWDASTWTELVALETHPVTSMAFSADGKRIVSAGLDKTVKLWDVATRQELCTLTVPAETSGVAFSPDSRAIAVTSKDNKVRLWTAGSER